MDIDELIKALKVYIKETIRDERANTNSHYVFAQFVSAETVDANLSKLLLPDGTFLRGVPRIKNGQTFVAGDQLVCIGASGSMPLIIIGQLSGKISLYGV